MLNKLVAAGADSSTHDTKLRDQVSQIASRDHKDPSFTLCLCIYSSIEYTVHLDPDPHSSGKTDL